MKVILLLSFFIFGGLAFGQDSAFFSPTREGQSFYELSNRYTKKILKKKTNQEIVLGMDKVLERAFNDELEADEFILYTAQIFEDVLKNCKKGSRCERKTLEALYLIGRKNKKIDDVLLFLLMSHLDEKVIPNGSLVNYYYKLEFTQRLREEISGDNSLVLENLFNSGKQYLKKEKGFGELTPRLRLFLFYNEREMEELTLILRRFLNRNFSTESYLIFELESGEEDRIDLSETEKYKAAVKLFDREIKRSYEDGKFRRYPLYSDVLALGLETGVISNDMLNEMLMLPEIQDPYTSFWQKVGAVAYRVGRTVLMINPATSLYAMSAFLVIDAVRQIKEENEKVSNDHLF